MPSSPRQCRSAPAQGRTWIFPESRTILGAESPEMRKAVSQGDGRHVGLRALRQKLVPQKRQSSLPQERGWGGLAPPAKAGLQRAQADAEMIGDVGYGDLSVSLVDDETLGATHDSRYRSRHALRELFAVVVRVMMQQ